MTPRVDVLRICGTNFMVISEKIGLFFGQKQKNNSSRENQHGDNQKNGTRGTGVKSGVGYLPSLGQENLLKTYENFTLFGNTTDSSWCKHFGENFSM